MHRSAIAAALLALSTPALAADLDYPPPVVQRERIIERRTYVPAPRVVEERRVYVEPRVVVRPRVYSYYEPYGYAYWDGPGYRRHAWRGDWDRRPYAYARWGWGHHRHGHWR